MAKSNAVRSGTKSGAKKGAAGRKSPGRKQEAALVEAAEIDPAEEMAIDRRGRGERRGPHDRRTKNLTVAEDRRTIERRTKVSRRRQIDPTTCERDYTSEEIEFMAALDTYKRTSGRMFPTCSEILEVIRDLGYQKPPLQEPPAEPQVHFADQPATDAAPTEPPV